jgi:hypothetical protein
MKISNLPSVFQRRTLAHRSCGAMLRSSPEKMPWRTASTGLCVTVVVGRTGRGAKPPPQLGQTFANTVSTQVAQKVHSKLQMRACVEAGGSAALQCSQVGLRSSMVTPGFLT